MQNEEKVQVEEEVEKIFILRKKKKKKKELNENLFMGKI